MYCANCNFDNNSDNKFCESCGKPLDKTLADTQPIRRQSLEKTTNHYQKKKSKNNLHSTSHFKAIVAVFISLALLGSVVLLLASLGEIILGISDNNVFQESTETPPPISNLSLEELRSEILDCRRSNGGCTSEKERAILAQHVGKRVHWEAQIIGQDGYSLLMWDGRISFMLHNLHAVDFSNYKENQWIMFEGTIVFDPSPDQVWALDEVVIDPIAGIDIPHPKIVIENVNLEVTSIYKVIFTLNNTSGQPVEVCFFASISFDEDGYYRFLQNEKNNGKCVNTVPIGESTYTYELGTVNSDDYEHVGELEIELRALKDNDIVVWDSWGSISRYTQVIQLP